MKKAIEGYLSKSNLKNFNTFYKEYKSLYNKKNLTLISKSQKPNYFYQKKKVKSINIKPLSTEPYSNQFNSEKKINPNITGKDFNLKNSIKQKLKILLKTPTNKRNLSRNLKSQYENSNTLTLDGEKTNAKNCIMNFINDYEKDFFSDSIYLNLDYNENEIYNNEFFYEDLIRKKIIYFRNKQTFNKKKKFEKKFFYGKYQKEINLTFNSLQITFQRMILPSEMQNQESEPPITFDLPFDLLPIFYYKGIHTFIKFLSRVIRIENNFEKIIFKEDKLCEELSRIKEYEINLDESNELEGSLILDLISESSNSNRNITYKEDKKNKFIHLKPQSLNRGGNFLKFSHFIFFWITNTKTYITTVSLPSIHLNILDNKITINNFVDYELLFHLYRKNFENWEYYIIKNLSCYSKFRTVFQQINCNSKVYDKNIYLKEPKQKINAFSDETLVNVYTDQFNNNIILVFRSFHVLATITDLCYHSEKSYNLHFNFFQYIKLYEVAKYSSKVYFLIKFMTVNKEYNTLNFNYEEFDKFDNQVWMSNIKKFSIKSLYKNELKDDLVHEFGIFPKKIRVEYVMPKYSIIKMENENEILKTLDIGKDLEKDLIDSMENAGSDSWTKFLNECLKKLNEPVPVLPSIHKRGHRKRDGRKLRFSSNDSTIKNQRRLSKFN
jgi:hypothetical protein